MKRFAVRDRVIWRNKNNRLRHGIVEHVIEGALLVRESFASGAPKNPGIYDNSFYLTGDELETVAVEAVVRKQNL
jgi:hypothetical protein